MIPEFFVGIALEAVASQHQRTLIETSVQLGVSVPKLIQECLHLAEDPQVYAQHPRPCRVIRERQQQAREARSARLGGSVV